MNAHGKRMCAGRLRRSLVGVCLCGTGLLLSFLSLLLQHNCYHCLQSRRVMASVSVTISSYPKSIWQ